MSQAKVYKSFQQTVDAFHVKNGKLPILLSAVEHHNSDKYCF